MVFHNNLSAQEYLDKKADGKFLITLIRETFFGGFLFGAIIGLSIGILLMGQISTNKRVSVLEKTFDGAIQAMQSQE